MANPTMQLTGLFFPAPGKKADTGLQDPYVLFIKDDENEEASSRAIIFEPNAVVSMPTTYSKTDMVSIEVYADAFCSQKQGGAYFTDVISSAINNYDIDATYTYLAHNTYV